tara:strand:- start:825 stop:1064 length:240 start_codon:yes stop_codon:yes gene_type:complete
MFFVRVGSVVAWLATIGGALKFAIGFFIASSLDRETMIAASKHYFNAANSGEIINESIPVFLFGIVIGILVHIAKNSKT